MVPKAGSLLNFDRATFEPALYEFLENVKIVSKDEGERPIMPLMGSQQYALDQVLDGLSRGVHWFVVDKSRQMGSTTLWLATSLFWCGLYGKLQGGIIADTEANKEETVRARIDEMIDGLMESNYPLLLRKGRSGHNKNGVHFENGSVLQYLVAGTRRGSGSLGRSRSLNYLLSTEVAGYGDPEQIETVTAALSDTNPNRLYIWESTPNSFNHFYDMWQDAVVDTIAKRAIFIGWWQNEKYAYTDTDPLYERYGSAPFSPEEQATAEEVERRWGHRITMGQWAWYRHHKNPQNGTEIVMERAERFYREFPSTPEEGFRSSGSPFMNPRAIGRAEEIAKNRLFKPFCYDLGDDHRAMRFSEGKRGHRVDLKMWQEPVDGASYIVSADAAYASGESADAYAAQVLRCYADKTEQVAEFHRKGIEPYQFTWVLAHLCGLFVNVRLIVEINGPGEAVMSEFRHIRTLAANGQLVADEDDLEAFGGLSGNFLARVKTYLFHRPDSLGTGYAIQWKTSEANRTPLLIGLADQIAIGQCDINSLASIDEMRRLRQTGSVIEPEGRAKDDRVVSLALGVRAWLDWERSSLRAAGRTWDTEHASPDKPAGDPVAQFLTYNINRDREVRAMRSRMAINRERYRGKMGHWGW